MGNVIGLGHRGAAFHAPQNTAASMRKAVEFGIDGIETDVHLTRDGVPVIHHNYTIDSTSDGSGTISLMTYEELLQYDFGSYKGAEFAGERILTLPQLLDIVRDLSVINIELKAPVKKGPELVRTTLKCVEEAGLADKVIYSSFDVELLRQVREERPGARIGFLTWFEGASDMLREMPAMFLSSYPVPNAEEILKAFPYEEKSVAEQVETLPFRPDYLHPDYRSVLLNPGLVQQMHERGIGVNPYTCDKPEDMRTLIAAGCDAIITNRPDVFLKVVNE